MKNNANDRIDIFELLLQQNNIIPIVKTAEEKAGRNLNKAKVVIDDEWYTRYEDIEKYIENFRSFLKDKVIYSPFDGEASNFVKYFKNNKGMYKEFIHSSNDFRHESNIEKWNKADIIITNPPFSLKKEFYEMVKKYKCEVIVLLPDTLISNTAYEQDLITRKLFMDYTNKSFIRPNGEIKRASASWFNSIFKAWTKDWMFKNGDYQMANDGIRYYNRSDNVDPNYLHDMYVPITWLKGTNIDNYEIIKSLDGVLVGTKKIFKVLLIRKKNETKN